MKRSLPLVLAAAILLVAAVPQQPFSDVDPAHANAAAIHYVQMEGIVSGYPDGEFRPENPINRAEFTKIIMETIHPEADVGTECFTDIRGGWYARYVCAAKQKGIVSGYPDGSFGADRRIGFAEAAKILVHAFGIEAGTDPEVWYRPYVRALADRAAIPLSVVSIGEFITRGEMAEMIWRLKVDVRDRESRTEDSLVVAAPELVSIDDDWNLYTNRRLGFSMHVPKLAESYRCGHEIGDRHVDPMLVVEGEDMVYVTPPLAAQWENGRCVEEQATVPNLGKRDPGGHWKITVTPVSGIGGIDDYVRETFAPGCWVEGYKPSTTQDGVLDVSLFFTSPDDPNPCFVNWIYVLKYSPARKLLVHWDIGQDVNFGLSRGEEVEHFDWRMTESFRFE